MSAVDVVIGVGVLILAANTLLGGIAVFTKNTPIGRWLTKKKPLFEL